MDKKSEEFLKLLKPIKNKKLIKSIIGKKQGMLTIIELLGSCGGRVCWLAKCDCGNTKVVKGSDFNNGSNKTCGCTNLWIKHGGSIKGRVQEEYIIWGNMCSRCNNINNPRYTSYGGKGIKVCERWKNFVNFLKDMNPRPSKLHSIDRIDNNGNYEPNNCRWATNKEQCRNKNNNRLIEFAGKVLSVTEWSEVVGIARTTITHRLDRGWSIERALTTK